jgi:hypothetical protein
LPLVDLIAGIRQHFGEEAEVFESKVLERDAFHGATTFDLHWDDNPLRHNDRRLPMALPLFHPTDQRSGES